MRAKPAHDARIVTAPFRRTSIAAAARSRRALSSPRGLAKEQPMAEESARAKEKADHVPGSQTAPLGLAFHGVRYQTKYVAASAAFYRDHLGFEIRMQRLPDFAVLGLGPL